MRVPPIVTAAVLALVPAALFAAPPAATKAPAGPGREAPVIRVVIDHESHLALVPEGTVIPQGLRIYSSQVEDPDADTDETAPAAVGRPLVFAYAPEERFATLQTAPPLTPDLEEVTELGEGPLAEPNATTSYFPCPSTVMVESGPGVVHQVTCYYVGTIYTGFTQRFDIQLDYPTEATLKRLWDIGHYLNTGWDQVFNIKPCADGSGYCHYHRGWGTTPGMNITWDSKSFVKLPGGCTQDPPSCPWYSTTLSYEIKRP